MCMYTCIFIVLSTYVYSCTGCSMRSVLISIYMPKILSRICTHVHVYIFLNLCSDVYMYKCIWFITWCPYIHKYLWSTDKQADQLYIYVCVCIYVRICICIHAYMLKHVYMCIYVYTAIHIIVGLYIEINNNDTCTYTFVYVYIIIHVFTYLCIRV